MNDALKALCRDVSFGNNEFLLVDYASNDEEAIDGNLFRNHMLVEGDSVMFDSLFIPIHSLASSHYSILEYTRTTSDSDDIQPLNTFHFDSIPTSSHRLRAASIHRRVRRIPSMAHATSNSIQSVSVRQRDSITCGAWLLWYVMLRVILKLHPTEIMATYDVGDLDFDTAVRVAVKRILRENLLAL